MLKNGSTSVPATVTYNAADADRDLDAARSLAYATTYTATLSGAKDLSGNTMASVSWSFTTTPAPRHGRSDRDRAEPGSGATGCRSPATSRRRFSEEVAAGHDQLRAQDRGDHGRRARSTYNPATQTVTLTPARSLAYATTYTATLSGAQDLYGNTMSSVSWSFTTASAPSTTAPDRHDEEPGSRRHQRAHRHRRDGDLQ